jgi:hypothetical protein
VNPQSWNMRRKKRIRHSMSSVRDRVRVLRVVQ